MLKKLSAWLSGVLSGAGAVTLKELGVTELTTMDELDAAFNEEASPFFLFKHSTTCPVSASAYRRVADYLATAQGAAPPFFLIKVIESRPVSNAVAERLRVTHQSPQLILVQGDTALWNASHGAISASAIEKALEIP